MNQCFDFEYKGVAVKAFHDSASGESIVEDFAVKIGSTVFQMKDLEWNEKYNTLMTELETEAEKVFNKKKEVTDHGGN